MSNNPVLPIPPTDAGRLPSIPVGDEDKLQTENPDLDDGETADSQSTVESDQREADDVNENLDK
jgi:hypothetical protein